MKTLIAVLLFTTSMFATAYVTQNHGSPVRMPAADVRNDEWPNYGHGLDGSKYSPLTTIKQTNVAQLKPAWTFATGHLDRQAATPKWQIAKAALEVTPIMLERKLFLCDPLNSVFALDAASGKKIWSYDPDVDGQVSGDYVCRGVAAWVDHSADPKAVCSREIFVATSDARLIALDAETGKPCEGFGRGGQVSLKEGLGDTRTGEYSPSSPPTVVGDLVILGSGVADNWRKDAPSGVIRAYDVRSGKMRWAWDPVPSGYHRPSNESGDWARGTPNAWFVFSADEPNDMLFLGTGNASPDLFGGERNNLDFYGSSIVALKASTGQYLWHFQTVHHDLWDYDVDSQPILFTLHTATGDIPALAQATKAGHIFVLDRRDGKPIFPVEERPVPQSDVAGEYTSPTQPFPVKPAPLYEPYKDLFTNSEHSYGCKIPSGARYEGIFTPPSLQGGISFPGPLGGTEWGGASLDPLNQILIVPQNQIPFMITLVPKKADHIPIVPKLGDPVATDNEMEGTPYTSHRTTVPYSGFFGFLGVPCLGSPAGELIAINLADGSVRWRKPLGSMYKVITGSLNAGGALVTGGGLLFIAGGLDSKIHAMNTGTGDELWSYSLPVPAAATPMTYSIDGEQYVVIAAGGHPGLKTSLDDKIIAFKLSSGR